MQKKEMERDGMKKGLLGQITKFGLVGVLCFFVDYFTYRLGNYFFETTGIAASFPAYVYVSQALGFTDSVIVNYLLSMKYVFARKDNLSRKEEFSIFLILSIIGLVVNEICLYVGLDLIYAHWGFIRNLMSYDFAKDVFFKCGATGVVMVYNFVTRKIFLEKKEKAA